MKKDFKIAKQEMKEKCDPYKTYQIYIGIPIYGVVVYVLSFLNVTLGNTGILILTITILGNKGASKLTLLSKRKYVAPILMYITNALVILFVIPIIIEISNGGTGDIVLGLANLIALPVQIVAFVFFFITANDIKKAYPDMTQVFTEARQEYLSLKREAKID